MSHPITSERKLNGAGKTAGNNAGSTAGKNVESHAQRAKLEPEAADRDAVALAIARSSEGRHAEAIQLLSEVARRHPINASVQADLAMALLSAGQLEDAIWGFSEALRLDPLSAQAQCGLGLAYQRLGRWQEAAEAFRLTELRAPDQPVGPFNLGLALHALGEHEEARQALLRAAALAPDDREIRDALAALAAPAVAADLAAPLARFTGDLATFGLSEVLELLRIQRKTGALVISSRQGAGIVRLVQGRLTSASAPGVQRLGETLVSRGVIDRAELEAALAAQRADLRQASEALGNLLLRQRPGAAGPLTEAILRQIVDGLAEMLSWREGAFSFHPGAAAEVPPISFDTQRVVMELFRTTDERASRRSST